MYKIVAIDLDGTMLTPYGTVTENTKEKIKQTIDQGTDVIIATGRPVIAYLKNLASEIGSKNYFIAGNGAMIYDIKQDKTIYKKYLTKDKVLNIVKICEENSIFFNVYTENSIITKSLQYNALYYNKENLKREENKRIHINIVENIYEYIKNMEEEDFLKITICDETQAIFNSIINKMRTIKDVEVLDVSHMSRKIIKQGTQEISIEYFYTEVSRAGVDKWYALEYLMENLQIKKEEVITIGDNINDLKMIQNAGIGIAMGESTPILKKEADYVTADNSSEGVAEALEKYIINNN